MNSKTSLTSSSSSSSDDENMDQLHTDTLVFKGGIIGDTEYQIDVDHTLYLFTWSPDPSRLPDAEFEIQHEFCKDLIIDFLKGMQIGCACVESTQLGNPHYHGWYQLSNDSLTDRIRRCMVKTLQQLGLLKITRSKGHYKANYWSDWHNCLFYYKKDLLDAMLSVPSNPITEWTEKSTITWQANLEWFRPKLGRHSIDDLRERISIADYYRDFYNNTYRN